MQEVRVRTLRRAAEIMGGEQPLAVHLRVTPSHLALWLEGKEVPPDHIFLKAVDLVTEHDALPSAASPTEGAPEKAPGSRTAGRR